MPFHFRTIYLHVFSNVFTDDSIRNLSFNIADIFTNICLRKVLLKVSRNDINSEQIVYLDDQIISQTIKI